MVVEVNEIAPTVILNEVKDPSIARTVTLSTLCDISGNREVPRFARDDTRKIIPIPRDKFVH